jgi:hypothetical protein
MRPVPLFSEPELVDILANYNPLDPNGKATDTDYLSHHLGGATAIVAQNKEKLNQHAEAASRCSEVSSVVTKLSTAGTADQLEKENLFERGECYDSILYVKSRLGWMQRSPDFQRLTAHLNSEGTLIAKTKWVPDSDRLSLEDISLIGKPTFKLPSVYLRYTKEQASLADFRSTSSQRESATVSTDGGAVATGGVGDRFTSQFAFEESITEYSPGWSWHSKLQEFVAEKVSAVDGETINLCCGTSSLGDVRVDKIESVETADGTVETAATRLADARDLPFNNDRFGMAIMDPPWKVSLRDRIDLLSEAVRVVEQGGSVLHNAWWTPWHPYCYIDGLYPTIANVLDSSINGPGGLSFLTELDVRGPPNIDSEMVFTLSEWAELVGEDNLRNAIPNHHPPWESPGCDPRIMSNKLPTPCTMCGSEGFSIRWVRDKPIYDCVSCSYPNSGVELINRGKWLASLTDQERRELSASDVPIGQVVRVSDEQRIVQPSPPWIKQNRCRECD